MGFKSRLAHTGSSQADIFASCCQADLNACVLGKAHDAAAIAVGAPGPHSAHFRQRAGVAVT